MTTQSYSCIQKTHQNNWLLLHTPASHTHTHTFFSYTHSHLFLIPTHTPFSHTHTHTHISLTHTHTHTHTRRECVLAPTMVPGCVYDTQELRAHGCVCLWVCQMQIGTAELPCGVCLKWCEEWCVCVCVYSGVRTGVCVCVCVCV